MIIVEGCDNAGKTTLVQRLSDELRLLVILNRRRPRSLPESWDYLIRAMPLVSSMPTVMDRFMAVSEPIYGPICRNSQLYKWEDVKDQFRFVGRSLGSVAHRSRMPLIVYCRPALSRILDFGDRPQMAGVINNAKALVDAYDETIPKLRELGVPIVLYDYEQREAYDRVLSAAQAHIKAIYQ